MRGALGVPMNRPLQYAKSAYPRASTLQRANTMDSLGTGSAPTTITATTDGTANVKGAWAEVIASTELDYDGVEIRPKIQVNGTITSTLFDIGIGAAAAEVVIVPDVVCGFLYNPGGTMPDVMGGIRFPVRIPAGSRVAIRVQGSRLSTATTFAISQWLVAAPGAARSPTALVQYGADAATSGATVVAPHASLNTESAWTEITASTNEALRGIIVRLTGPASAGYVASNMLVDLAVGAAGQEQVIAANIVVAQTAQEAIVQNISDIIDVLLPVGVRLSLRHQRSGALALQGQLIGIPL